MTSCEACRASLNIFIRKKCSACGQTHCTRCLTVVSPSNSVSSRLVVLTRMARSRNRRVCIKCAMLISGDYSRDDLATRYSVRELRTFLLGCNMSIAGCTEKEDLIELAMNASHAPKHSHLIEEQEHASHVARLKEKMMCEMQSDTSAGNLYAQSQDIGGDDDTVRLSSTDTESRGFGGNDDTVELSSVDINSHGLVDSHHTRLSDDTVSCDNPISSAGQVQTVTTEMPGLGGNDDMMQSSVGDMGTEPHGFGSNDDCMRSSDDVVPSDDPVLAAEQEQTLTTEVADTVTGGSVTEVRTENSAGNSATDAHELDDSITQQQQPTDVDTNSHVHVNVTSIDDATLSTDAGIDDVSANTPPTPASEPSSASASPFKQSSEHRRVLLSEIPNETSIELLTIRQLKELLVCNFVDYKGCCEKAELVTRVRQLWSDHQRNITYVTSTSSDSPSAEFDSNLCKVCMDAVTDCLLLDCGHMVTCTACGKRLSQCPICRQYVVRVVRVFRA